LAALDAVQQFCAYRVKSVCDQFTHDRLPRSYRMIL
jgi:hypothetical protein